MIYLTISTSNDIKLLAISALITSLLWLFFVVSKNMRFIKNHQRDNEMYREKTIQQLNEKDLSDG